MISLLSFRYDTGLKMPNKRIDTLDQLLSSQDYLVQDKFTVADVAVSSYLLYVLQFFPGIDISRWPNVVRYMKDCVSRKAYGDAFGSQVQGFLQQALKEMDDEKGDEEPKKLFGMF